jgi:hypothetical protein
MDAGPTAWRPGAGDGEVKISLCHSGMRHLAQARNPRSPRWLWIPGSRKSAPRNDNYCFFLCAASAANRSLRRSVSAAIRSAAG